VTWITSPGREKRPGLVPAQVAKVQTNLVRDSN